jgi:hypothetical protein
VAAKDDLRFCDAANDIARMWQSDAAPEGRAPKALPAQQRKQQASAPAIIEVRDKGNQFAESPFLVLRLEIQLHGCERKQFA